MSDARRGKGLTPGDTWATPPWGQVGGIPGTVAVGLRATLQALIGAATVQAAPRAPKVLPRLSCAGWSCRRSSPVLAAGAKKQTWGILGFHLMKVFPQRGLSNHPRFGVPVWFLSFIQLRGRRASPLSPRTPHLKSSRPKVQITAGGREADGSFLGPKGIRIDKGKITGRFSKFENGVENGKSPFFNMLQDSAVRQ